MNSPFTGGHATLKSRYETFPFRKEEFTILRHYYECDQTGQCFTDKYVDRQMMDDIYSQYRKRHNIPSPEELKALKECYGFSAHAMSKIAGLGINQYGLYESGEQLPTPVVGHRLAALFNKDEMIRSIDMAKDKLGRNYQAMRERAQLIGESDLEPITSIKEENNLNFDIARRIAELLVNKKMSELELAKRMNMQENDVNGWLSGRYIFNTSIISKISNAIGEPIIAVAR